MNCVKCGVELPDDSLYCAECGARQVAAADVAAPAEAVLDAPQEPIPAPEPEATIQRTAPEPSAPSRGGVTYASGFGKKKAFGPARLSRKQKVLSTESAASCANVGQAQQPVKKKKKLTCSCFSTILLLLVFLGIVAMGIPGFMAEKERERQEAMKPIYSSHQETPHQNKCINMLDTVALLEKMYKGENGEYTEDMGRLAKYGATDCDDPAGISDKCKLDGETAVSAMLRKNCPEGSGTIIETGKIFIYGCVGERLICKDGDSLFTADYDKCDDDGAYDTCHTPH